MIIKKSDVKIELSSLVILHSGQRLSKKDFKFEITVCNCKNQLVDKEEVWMNSKIGTCFQCTPGFTPLMFASRTNRIYLPTKEHCEYDASRAKEIDPESTVHYVYNAMKQMYLLTWDWRPARALVHYGPNILKEVRCLRRIESLQ